MRTLKRKDIKAYKQSKIGVGIAYCPITLVEITASNAVLDHDHTTGRCRNIIDRNANQFLGKLESNYKRFLGYKRGIESLPSILRYIALYLERNYDNNPLHPSWSDLAVRKFGRQNKITQISWLKIAGINSFSKTSKERTKQYRDYLYEQ